jgi:hypothetical protein
VELVCALARSWEQGVAAQRSALWAAVHAAAVLQPPAGEGGGEGEGEGGGGGNGDAAAKVRAAWVACGGVTALGFEEGFGALVNEEGATGR